MTLQPLAWVLNLDAENELEVAGSYTPSRHMQAIVERESRRLFETLVAPGDVVLGTGRDEDARGRPGICWSPTRSGLERLRRAGATPVETPDEAVVRRVNTRAFATRVRATLDGNKAFVKELVLELDTALALLSRPTPSGSWLVRRNFGASGRGRRRIRVGSPDAVERAWLMKHLKSAPLVIEPWVSITREHTRSGWVEPNGSVHAAGPCYQATTREGAWKLTEAVDPSGVDRKEDLELEAAFHEGGLALAREGYFGPFGIDAFRYRTGEAGSPEVLNPLSEINARFTMDWTLGMEDGHGTVRRTFGC